MVIYAVQRRSNDDILSQCLYRQLTLSRSPIYFCQIVGAISSNRIILRAIAIFYALNDFLIQSLCAAKESQQMECPRKVIEALRAILCCVRIQYQDPCNGRSESKTWLRREKKAEANEPKLSYAKKPLKT